MLRWKIIEKICDKSLCIFPLPPSAWFLNYVWLLMLAKTVAESYQRLVMNFPVNFNSIYTLPCKSRKFSPTFAWASFTPYVYKRALANELCGVAPNPGYSNIFSLIFVGFIKIFIPEMALLLPASLSKNRHANDTSDIRQNLRLNYRHSFKPSRKNE